MFAFFVPRRRLQQFSTACKRGVKGHFGRRGMCKAFFHRNDDIVMVVRGVLQGFTSKNDISDMKVKSGCLNLMISNELPKPS